jgi:hypothetical protein
VTLENEPTSKVELEYDENNSRLIKITKINEDMAAVPFSILYFHAYSSFLSYSSPNSDVDRITEIRVRYQEKEQDVYFEGDEDSIIKEFHEYVELNILNYTFNKINNKYVIICR